MTALPDKEQAIAALNRDGFVRLGDHSATNLAQLEEIYGSRHAAWEEAERNGFGGVPERAIDPIIPPAAPAPAPRKR